MLRPRIVNLSGLSGLSGYSGGQLNLGNFVTLIEGYTSVSLNILCATGKDYYLNGVKYTGTNAYQSYPSGFFSIRLDYTDNSVGLFYISSSTGSSASQGYISKLIIDGRCFSNVGQVSLSTSNLGQRTNTDPAYQINGPAILKNFNGGPLSTISLNGFSSSTGQILIVDSVLQSSFTLSNSQVSTIISVNSDFNPKSLTVSNSPAFSSYPTEDALQLETLSLTGTLVEANLLLHPVVKTVTLNSHFSPWQDISSASNIENISFSTPLKDLEDVPFNFNFLPSTLKSLYINNGFQYFKLEVAVFKSFPQLTILALSSYYGNFPVFDTSYFPALQTLTLTNSRVCEFDFSTLTNLQVFSPPSRLGKTNLRACESLQSVSYAGVSTYYYTPSISPKAPCRTLNSVSSPTIIPEQGDKLYNELAYIKQIANNYTGTPFVSGGTGWPIGGRYSIDAYNFLSLYSSSVKNLYSSTVWGHWTEDSMQSNGAWNNIIDSGNSRNFVALNGAAPTVTYKQGLNRRYKGLDFNGNGNRFLSCQTVLPFDSANWTLVIIGWMPEDVVTRQIIMSTYHGAQTGVRLGELNNVAFCNNVYTSDTVSTGTGFNAANSDTRVYPLVPFGLCVVRTGTSIQFKLSVGGRLLTSFSNYTITSIGTGTETRLGGFSPGTYLFKGTLHEVIMMTSTNDIYSSYVVPKVQSLSPAGVSVIEDISYAGSLNAYHIASVTSPTASVPAVSSLNIASPSFGSASTVSGSSRYLGITNSHPCLTSANGDYITLSNTTLSSWKSSSPFTNTFIGLRPDAYTLIFVGQTNLAYPTAQPLCSNFTGTNGVSFELHFGDASSYGKTLDGSVRFFAVGTSNNTDVTIRGQGVVSTNTTFIAVASYETKGQKLRLLVYQNGLWRSYYSTSIADFQYATNSLMVGSRPAGYARTFRGAYQNFVIYNRFLETNALKKVIQNNLSIFNSNDSYLTVRSIQQAAQKPTGIYKFITKTGTSFPVYIKDGEILIGRGRNNWNWTNNGIGTPDEVTFCVEDEVKYPAFTPRYLSKANIDAILTASELPLNRVKTKIYRAIDAFSSKTQTITWRLRNATWDWNMWNNLPIDEWSVETPGLDTITGTNGGTSSNGTNDITRWLTYVLAETNNQVGFAGGYFAEGTTGLNNWGSEDSVNYGYQYNNSSYTTPYSEVYLSLAEPNQITTTFEKEFMDLTKYNDCIGLYGFVALSDAYQSLPICQLYNFTTATLQDFTAAQLANNEHLTFAGANSVGVYKLYDQSGSGNTLTAISQSSSPFIVVSGVGVNIDGQIAMRGHDGDAQYMTFATPVAAKSVYFTLKDVYPDWKAPVLGGFASNRSVVQVNNNNTTQIQAPTGTGDSIYAAINESSLVGPASSGLSPAGSSNWSTEAGVFGVYFSNGPNNPFATYMQHGAGSIADTIITAKVNFLALYSTDKRASHASIRNSIRYLLNPLNSSTAIFGWWDETSIETNGNGDFIRWNDKTLNGNYLKIKNGAPVVSTHSNKRCISLNGSSSLETTLNNLSGAVSFYIVAKASNNSVSTLMTNGGSSLIVNTGYGQGNANFFLTGSNGSFSTSTSTSTYIVPNTIFVGSTRWSSTLGSVNGIQGTIDSSASSGSVATGSFADGTTLTIGETSNASYFTGQVCEIIAFNSRVSDTQHAAIMNYLKGKWAAVTTPPSFLLYNQSSSVLAHFDASTLEDVDSAVSTWKPTYGSSFYDLTALPSAAPVVKNWRELKTVYFDGTGTGFSSDALPNSKTITMVGRIETNQTRAFLMHSSRAGIQLDFESTPTTINQVTSGTEANTNVTDADGVNSGNTTNSDFLLIAYWDETQCKVGYDIQFNGILLSDTNVGTGDFTADNVAHNWFRYLYDNSLQFKGYIAEITIYDRPLGTAERTALRSRLIEKYGGF